MKSIKQWLMENDQGIRKVDLKKIFGGTTVQIRPEIYTPLKQKLDAILDSLKDDFVKHGLDKAEVFRQVVAIAADQISDDKDSRVLSVSAAAKGLSGGFGPDEPIARETV